jgi:hypothetical protein
MDEFNSETDSDYASYWRDWVSSDFLAFLHLAYCATPHESMRDQMGCLITYRDCFIMPAGRRVRLSVIPSFRCRGQMCLLCVRSSVGHSNRRAGLNGAFLVDSCKSCEVSSVARLLDFQIMNPTTSTSITMDRRRLWTDRHLYPYDTTTAIDRTDYLRPLRNRVSIFGNVPVLLSPSLPFNIGNLAAPPYFRPDNPPVQGHPSASSSSDADGASSIEGPWMDNV